MNKSFAAAVTTAVAASIAVTGEPWMYKDPYNLLQVTLDGEPLDLYIAQTHWSEIMQDDSSSYTMAYNGRTYLTESEDWDPNAYFKPNLLGGSMEYDVDMSAVSCGCNAALYLIGMPGVGADGLPFESSDGMHYCDAAAVGGNYCPEFDIMEANQWAYRACNHECNEPQNGHYSWCDRAGTCSVDIITDDHPETAYGPGSQYTINTDEEFHIKIDFEQDPADGQFAKYTITLSQEGRQVLMVSDCKESLSKMTQVFTDGMTVAMSMWASGDFDWLQHGRCSGQCTQQDLSFKNLSFTTAAGNHASTESEDDEEIVTEDEENVVTEEEEEEEHHDDTTPISDIRAGFDAIRNTPYYDDHTLSRTLYQVDRTFDFIEQKLIEMAAKLNDLDGQSDDDANDEEDNHQDEDDNEEEDDQQDDDQDDDDQTEEDQEDDEDQQDDESRWDGVVNPFEGKTLYVNPTYQANLQTSIATASGTARTNLETMMEVSSAYWIDVKAKLRGTDTTSLEGILTDATAKGHMVTLIAYDLPNRDCAAHASNGEICCKYNADGTCDYGYSGSCDAGLNEYKTEYIDVFAEILSRFEGRVDMAVVIEPDSLPNLATNLESHPHCVNSQTSYTEGIAYAINAFASRAPSAALYLDGAHGGWLGWPGNMKGFGDIVRGLPYDKLRGFATNVANYQPLGIMCPWQGEFVEGAERNNYCLNGAHSTDPCCEDPCGLSDEWNGAHSELNYVQALSKQFGGTGWEPRFIIDTGRNGQPDSRTQCSNWCNIRESGVGRLPTTSTGHSSIDAFLWLKTPGESDGCTQTLPDGSTCPRFDQMCASSDSIGTRSFEPRAPEAGGWFDYQVKQLAENAIWG